MNIVYNNKDTTCKFCMIATGDVFSSNDVLYMRIQKVKSVHDGILYNAATLQSGLLATFEEDDYVVPVEANLVLV